jgi:hypothetical protein
VCTAALVAAMLSAPLAIAAPARPRGKAKPAAVAPATLQPNARAPEVKVGVAEPPVPSEVVKTVEAKEGVKTYTFGAQEVEGRLRSPQILYFLRRVRAEFDPQPLGHRSFLLDLRDTRRHPAF